MHIELKKIHDCICVKTTKGNNEHYAADVLTNNYFTLFLTFKLGVMVMVSHDWRH